MADVESGTRALGNSRALGETIIAPVPALAAPRSGWSRLVNMLIPGTALTTCGRPWSGLALAVLWGVSAHTAIAGWLLAPESWPRWITIGASAMVVACWGAAWRMVR